MAYKEAKIIKYHNDLEVSNIGLILMYGLKEGHIISKSEKYQVQANAMGINTFTMIFV